MKPVRCTLVLTILLVGLLPSVFGQEYNLRNTIFDASEGDSHVLLTIDRTGSVSSPTSILVTTIAGTASSPGDYVQLNQRREFIENNRYITVRIDLQDDSVKEDQESFQVLISSPSAGTIGSNSIATINIQDDDADFSFERASYPIESESVGAITVALVRNGYADKQVDVYVSTSDGNPVSDTKATPGADFTPLSESQISFPSGEDKVLVQVPIVPDAIPERTEAFNVEIVRVDGGGIGSIPATTLYIEDDDVEYAIVEESFSIKEGTFPSQVTVTVVRNFNLNAPGTIQLYTEDGTASSVAGDYVATFTTIDFAGTVAAATATLTILDDNVYEPERESFFVGIRSPTPYGFVSAQASRRPVYIEDNESIISLASAAYTVEENEEQVTVQIRRTGDLSVESSVRIRSISVSATADVDYTAFDLEVRFAPNQAGIDLRIGIVNDDVTGEEDETFIVELYNAAVSILSTTANSATVTIQDSQRLSTLAIVLIVVGCTIFIVILLIMILCCCAFMRNSEPSDPFYYDRDPRDGSMVDFPQESSYNRGPVVTYIPNDFDDHRENRHRLTNGAVAQNGGSRITEIHESGNRPSQRDAPSIDQSAAPVTSHQDHTSDARVNDMEAAIERHGEQSDPRRARSMFVNKADREPYWQRKPRHQSHHSSPNQYGYF